MTANPVLLQKKYSRIVGIFAKNKGVSLDKALDMFYTSTTYRLLNEGVSDIHCMSDEYLAEELANEYRN